MVDSSVFLVHLHMFKCLVWGNKKAMYSSASFPATHISEASARSGTDEKKKKKLL